MKKLIAGVGAALVSSALPVAAADNDGWAVIGIDRKTNDPAAWIKLKNAEQINKDSFKVKYRAIGYEWDAKLNCRNKDIGFSNGQWSQVAGGWETIGEILCRHLPIRDRWGMTDLNSHLWNARKPEGKPADSTGEWVEVVLNDKNEEYYSDNVISDGRTVIFARYTRDKKADKGERTALDVEKYRWIIADCSTNQYSIWHSTEETYFGGFWLSPAPARPKSSVREVKKKFCKAPNTELISKRPLPTVEDLRKYAD